MSTSTAAIPLQGMLPSPSCGLAEEKHLVHINEFQGNYDLINDKSLCRDGQASNSAPEFKICRNSVCGKGIMLAALSLRSACV